MSRSDALRAYPDELLASPLDVRSAVVRYTPGATPGAPPELDAFPLRPPTAAEGSRR